MNTSFAPIRDNDNINVVLPTSAQPLILQQDQPPNNSTSEDRRYGGGGGNRGFIQVVKAIESSTEVLVTAETEKCKAIGSEVRIELVCLPQTR